MSVSFSVSLFFLVGLALSSVTAIVVLVLLLAVGALVAASLCRK